MFFLLLLILPGVRTQDPTPQSYLQPHRVPYTPVQFLQHKEQHRKGPILFPNDAPPPPPTPLIVTSRPLSESIARSELNPNNSLAAQSQYHQVSFKPNFLARGKNYDPYSYTIATVTPAYDFAPEKIIEERKEKFFKDYERWLEFMHPRKRHRKKRSADMLLQPNESRRCDQRRHLEFITPRAPHPKAVEVLIQALQQRSFYKTKKIPMVDENNNKKATTKIIEENYEFNEEDNNFDFDFKKYYTNGSKESDGSEYLEYYPETKKILRRQLARFADGELQFGPSNNRNNYSNGNAWRRLNDKEKTKPSDSVEDSGEIAEILGLPSIRKSVMRSVKYDVNILKSRNTDNYEMDRWQRNTSGNSSRRRDKPQLRVVKPQYEFDNAQIRQHSGLKVEPYNSKNHYFGSKNKGDEDDYSQETNPNDNYAFSYSVKDHKTGDDFSHSQKSTGSATKGEYKVLLPDGRTQIVSYTADENGYKADVRYDEHHNQDNSIDFDYDKDKSLDINDRHTVKQNFGHNQDYTGYEKILYRPQQTIAPTYKVNVPNYEQSHVENTNDYGDKSVNNYQYFNVYPTKAAFADTTANINDRTLDGLSDNNNVYLEQANARLEDNDKEERAKDDYKFSDELVDYSSELDHAYEPHKSKFSSLFNNNQNAQGQVRPSYDELKPLFVTNANGRRNAPIPVSTIRPVYAVTPADVVAITPKKPLYNLYTNIKNIATPAPFIFSTPSPSTPRSYLLSTIANLKHQINLANKPVLSDHYINKINKYLSYSNPVKVNK